ncbi:MAG: peroxiredoxin family protein [Chloroflexota bacterium]|nr:peroxiredoxin family protein [Chloroflexota bacterium]
MTVTVGDKLPDVALATLDGKSQRLADLLGERTLFFFWGSW